MTLNIFKDNQEKFLGIRYTRNLFFNGNNVVVLSLWKWDIVFSWEGKT